MNQEADREAKDKLLKDLSQLAERGSVVRDDVGQRDNVRQ